MRRGGKMRGKMEEDEGKDGGRRGERRRKTQRKRRSSSSTERRVGGGLTWRVGPVGLQVDATQVVAAGGGVLWGEGSVSDRSVSKQEGRNCRLPW